MVPIHHISDFSGLRLFEVAKGGGCSWPLDRVELKCKAAEISILLFIADRFAIGPKLQEKWSDRYR
jgi:hypothetical protein